MTPKSKRCSSPADGTVRRLMGRRASTGEVRDARMVTASQPDGRGGGAFVPPSRKVGAPKGRVLAHGQPGRPAGKCHREQTADGRKAQVRMKRCGKSAPAVGVTR